jgi:glycolate dehydrogenase FAD-binding subunit
MGGPVAASDLKVSTRSLNRILQYEPTDLTLSVEAGASFAEVSRVLAENRQMIPLDPPFADAATIGGVIATNGSGPRRRLYGSARDHVIGMQFATMEGKLVQSGGMVVKNVAGLDMGKLMIGSFGTLAAITVVNFKVSPKPAIEQTSLLSFETLDAALNARDKIIRSVLQPSAVDLLNPVAATQMGRRGFVLAVQYGGNAAVVARYQRELAALGSSHTLEGEPEATFWRGVQDYARTFTEKYAEGAVVRISCTLTQLGEVVSSLDGPVIARAASGVCYAYFVRTDAAAKWLATARQRPWRCVVEFSPESEKARLDLWPVPGDDFAMMKKVKQMFDPGDLLNHGRLFRLI